MENKETIEKKALLGKHVSNENWNSWRWQLKQSLSGYEPLHNLLRELDCSVGQRYKKSDEIMLLKLVERYRFRVTPYYLSLIDWSDPNDPIRHQCIPDMRELEETGAYSSDPFAEMQTAPDARFVHRYPDRVLLIATNNCAMYCRHCTRKNTLDNMHQSGIGKFDLALKYIEANPGIREVLISGGDPFLLDIAQLDQLLASIHAIEHIEVVRIGTRIPVVLPMRVDDELVEMLGGHKPLWINTQFNHPRELTAEAIIACRKLVDAGIPVSNQSVLLKNVNDSFDVMRELCAKLQRNLIRPYYLFQCDPIAGIDHFRTDISAGIELEDALQESLGGLCLPRFVADLPGQKGKTSLRQMQ